MPAFLFPNSTFFPLQTGTGRTFLKTLRANNVAELAIQATAYVADFNPGKVIVDFALSAGGGGNVDLMLLIGDFEPGSTGFPPTQTTTFEGFEATDGQSLDLEINRVLDGTEQTGQDEVLGWSTATGAAAGKVCVVLALTAGG
jgi:hypothetical protein